MKSLLAYAALALALSWPVAGGAQVSVSIGIAPPPLLVYAQPPAPGEGFIWTPGYWSWSEPGGEYFWVPGTWVQAPNDGDLWTPGYWAFENLNYVWHIGYWGRSVGFYGGINYGYGYFGSGYQGGRWDGGGFRYNRAYSNVDTRIVHRYYNAPVVHSQRFDGISFNGGRAGTPARPSPREWQFRGDEHAGPRPDQREHETTARGIPTQRATGPHGVPQVAATPRPSEFDAPNVEHVRQPPVGHSGRPEREVPTVHRPAEPQRSERQAAPQRRPEQPEREGPSRRER